MANEDRFRRWQVAGSELVESAKERAEALLRGAGIGGEHNGNAGHSENLVEAIRKEITRQLSMLGVATKDDLTGLEKRLKNHSHEGSAPRASARSKSAASSSKAPEEPKAKPAPRRRAAAKPSAPQPADE